MEFRLPSNSGNRLAKWIVTDRAEGHLYCNFEFQSRFGEQSPPGTVIQFTRLILNRDELAAFVRKADTWLYQPVCEVASHDFDAIVGMGGGFDNYLEVRFGANTAVESAQNSAATFRYCVAGVDGEFAYAIDQSCVRILIEGIKAVLRH